VRKRKKTGKEYKKTSKEVQKQRQRDAGNTVKEHKKIGKGDVRRQAMGSKTARRQKRLGRDVKSRLGGAK
jgi:hypothetical protein